MKVQFFIVAILLVGAISQLAAPTSVSQATKAASIKNHQGISASKWATV